MQGAALTALKGVDGTEGVLERFAAAVGKDAYVAQTIRWPVVARPAPVPATPSPAK